MAERRVASSGPGKGKSGKNAPGKTPRRTASSAGGAASTGGDQPTTAMGRVTQSGSGAARTARSSGSAAPAAKSANNASKSTKSPKLKKKASSVKDTTKAVKKAEKTTQNSENAGEQKPSFWSKLPFIGTTKPAAAEGAAASKPAKQGRVAGNAAAKSATSASHDFVDARSMTGKDYVSETLEQTSGTLGVVSRPKVVDFEARNKERKRASIWMILLRVLIGVAVACAVGVLVWLLFFSSVFRVQTDGITVEGANEWVTEQQVHDIADQEAGKSLLLVSSSKISKELNDVAGVTSVKVTKHLPKKLTVTVNVEKPAAILRVGKTLTAVDSQARTMASTDGKDISGIPTVDVASTSSDVQMRAVKETLTIFAAMSDELRNSITSASAKTQDSITTTHNNGELVVVWGDSSQLELKKADVEKIREKINNGEDGFAGKHQIDVSSPKQPVIK